MANPLKDKLVARYQALVKQRQEKAAEFQSQLALLDAEISALQTLAQNWDTYTVDQALTALAQAGVRLDIVT